MIWIDMEMPECCSQCKFVRRGSPADRDCGGVAEHCYLTGIYFTEDTNWHETPSYPENIPDWCPLHPYQNERIYVVTEGEYSDYQILGIFTSEEKAWKFASISYDRTVEEYMLDPVEVDGLINKNIHITYDFSKNEIVDVWLSDEEIPAPFISVEYRPCLFKFQISNTTRNFIEYARE